MGVKWHKDGIENQLNPNIKTIYRQNKEGLPITTEQNTHSISFAFAKDETQMTTAYRWEWGRCAKGKGGALRCSSHSLEDQERWCMGIP